MVTTSKKIWMDGVFVDWDDASVHVLTHSLHYGLAAFEGIRCYEGSTGSAIFRLSEHVDRLFESAHITLMPMPFSKKEVIDAIIETVRVNELASCYIRPLAYVGVGAMGLYPGDNPIRLSDGFNDCINHFFFGKRLLKVSGVMKAQPALPFFDCPNMSIGFLSRPILPSCPCRFQKKK